MAKRTSKENHQVKDDIKAKEIESFRKSLLGLDRSSKAKERFLINSSILALNQFKDVLRNKCSLEQFFIDRCAFKRSPYVHLLPEDSINTNENLCRKFLSDMIRFISSNDIFVEFIEFLGDKTKPCIKRRNLEQCKLVVESDTVEYKYGLIVMYFEDNKFFQRILFTFTLNVDHKVSHITLFKEVGLYNYVLREDLKLPKERKKVTHFADRHISYALPKDFKYCVSKEEALKSHNEFMKILKEIDLKNENNLDKISKIIVKKCPECHGLLEKVDSYTYRCINCNYSLKKKDHDDEEIMPCPECHDEDVIICYKWDEIKKRQIAYICCTGSPECKFHLSVKNKKE